MQCMRKRKKLRLVVCKPWCLLWQDSRAAFEFLRLNEHTNLFAVLRLDRHHQKLDDGLASRRIHSRAATPTREAYPQALQPWIQRRPCQQGQLVRFRCGGCDRPIRSLGLPVRSRRVCCADCGRKVNNEYYRLRRRVRHQERACAVCGVPFLPTRNDVVTCSNTCRQKLHCQRRSSQPAKKRSANVQDRNIGAGTGFAARHQRRCRGPQRSSRARPVVLAVREQHRHDLRLLDLRLVPVRQGAARKR